MPDDELIEGQVPVEHEYFIVFEGQNDFQTRLWSDVVSAKNSLEARKIAVAAAKKKFGCAASDLWMKQINKL